MKQFNKFLIANVLLSIAPFISTKAMATVIYSTAKCDARVLACGLAQIEANTCLKSGQDSSSEILGGLAAKLASSDLAKTVSNKAAGQAASMLCKDKIEKADAACKPIENKP